VWSFVDKSAIVNNPVIAKEKGYISGFSLKTDNYITEAELINYWGNPDEVTYNDKGQKQLLYKKSELRWSGVVAVVIVIPIPLLVPVGHDYFLFTVDNGNIYSVYMKTNYGDLLFGCGPDGCRVGANIDAGVPFYKYVNVGGTTLIRDKSEFAPNIKDSNKDFAPLK